MKELLGKLRLSIKFSIIVLFTLIVAAALSIGIVYLAIRIGVLPSGAEGNHKVAILSSLIACTIIGTIIASCVSRSAVKAVEAFVKASNRVADGDFTARIYVKKSIGEFKTMADNFNHMAEELGSIEVLRADFINNFSHEFKTPIVSIKGFAEILKGDDLTIEERNEYLDIVIEEAGRLAALANNVLAISKIEQQSILTDKRMFNLGEQIRQCILLLESKLEEKAIELDLHLNDYKVCGNKEMMSQVWVNLLDNAIKFSHEGGCISTYMKKTQTHLIITIHDNGCGISNQAMPRIFDKFYQADASHAEKGNGLGLAMVKKIITLHGGEISCKSELNKGTTFIVSLPYEQQGESSNL